MVVLERRRCKAKLHTDPGSCGRNGGYVSEVKVAGGRLGSSSSSGGRSGSGGSGGSGGSVDVALDPAITPSQVESCRPSRYEKRFLKASPGAVGLRHEGAGSAPQLSLNRSCDIKD